MNFYVGQEVVCIKSTVKRGELPLPITKGSHYIIKSISYCKKCGGQKIDIGYIDTEWMTNDDVCDYCDLESRCTDSIYWFESYRFVPLESIPASHEIAVKKLIEESISIKI